jgi:hypothetical protein
LLVALAGLAVMGAAGAVALWPRADRVTRANCDRIQTGMNRADVEAILGPPGDYRTGLGETRLGEVDYGITQNVIWMPDPATDLVPTLSNWSTHTGRWPAWPPSESASWMSDSFEISVTINESGSVVDKLGCPRRKTRELLGALLWRAKRQWHRWFP